MPVDTVTLSLENPVFHHYVLAASIMILKLMLQPWMTVARMSKVRGGFRSPEDAKKSPFNPNSASCAARVQRVRRSLPENQSE